MGSLPDWDRGWCTDLVHADERSGKVRPGSLHSGVPGATGTGFPGRGLELAGDEESRPEEHSAQDRALLALYTLDAEVNNGGFSQYFINTGGAWTEAAADALGAIGVGQTEALLRRAMGLLGSPFVEELSEQQWKALDDHASELHDCDEAYYMATEDVASLTMLWIQRGGS